MGSQTVTNVLKPFRFRSLIDELLFNFLLNYVLSSLFIDRRILSWSCRGERTYSCIMDCSLEITLHLLKNVSLFGPFGRQPIIPGGSTNKVMFKHLLKMFNDLGLIFKNQIVGDSIFYKNFDLNYHILGLFAYKDFPPHWIRFRIRNRSKLGK